MGNPIKYLFLAAVAAQALSIALIANAASNTITSCLLLASGACYIACVQMVLTEEKARLAHHLMMAISMLMVVVILFTFYAMVVFSGHWNL